MTGDRAWRPRQATVQRPRPRGGPAQSRGAPRGPAPPPATDDRDRASPRPAVGTTGGRRAVSRRSTEDHGDRFTSVCHGSSGVLLPLVKHLQSSGASTRHVTHRPESACAAAAGMPRNASAAFPEMSAEGDSGCHSQRQRRDGDGPGRPAAETHSSPPRHRQQPDVSQNARGEPPPNVMVSGGGVGGLWAVTR